MDHLEFTAEIPLFPPFGKNFLRFFVPFEHLSDITLIKSQIHGN